MFLVVVNHASGDIEKYINCSADEEGAVAELKHEFGYDLVQEGAVWVGDEVRVELYETYSLIKVGEDTCL